MNGLRILVVGAGIAGGAAAALLGRAGHIVTLVERAADARSSGSPVDIRGAALGSADRLGITARLRAHDTGARRLEIVDRAGRVRASAALRRPSSPDIEIARADLGSVLLAAAGEVAEVVTGDEPVALESDAGGVDVTLARGGERRFELVIGADGQHSAVRRLVSGAESGFRTALGLGIATARIPVELERASVVLHNEPGTSVGVHPAGGRPIASFIFRTSITDAPRTRAEQESLLRERFAAVGWRAAELLRLTMNSRDIYLDVVGAVRVPAWSRGRIALLGDSASSVTILGEGSSMAMLGAAHLSDALAALRDVPSALSAYERRHRPVVERRQRGVRMGAAFLVPRTFGGIVARDLAIRAGAMRLV